MSLELPHSSQVHVARRTLPPAPKAGRRLLGRALLAGLGLAAVLAGGLFAVGYIHRPRIERLEPSVGDPGGVVRLEGRNFGRERGDSRVEIDGVAPTTSSYLEWSDTGIQVRLPAAVDSGLVHVVTRNGPSNPRLFMNRARLPVRAQGERAGRSGPFIASIAPETGPVGSLVVITGLDFGANREDGSVRFAWSPEGGTGPRDDQSDPASVSPAEPELGYELWSDKEIRVRVPDGASSGALYVSGAAGSSNGVFFRVAAAPGIKRFKDRRSYSLSQGVSITKVKASGPNELYLWAPRPAESASQRVSKVLGQEPPPLVPDYRGTALFRFKDLASSRDLAMTQSYLVQVWAVETQVEADRVQARPEGAPPAMGAWLAADERVPASAPEVVAAAKRAAGGERNPWRATRQVWDWMTKNIAWTSSHEHARPQDALADKSADSWSYALLSCAILRAAGVPALPVAGYLVDPSRKAVRHYWLEVYLYGLGWVPLDPILGTGASPGGVQVAWDDRSRYLGSMDNRHLAFSRGAALLAPMAPGGRRAAKDRRWSFQSFYEEASGGLDAYSSFWGDVEVTGMY